jgi:Prophage minor tail protein Z (GPZ)
MIAISIDTKQLQRLEQSLKDKAHRLPRHLATAVNATARKVRSSIAKEIGKELAVKQKVIKDVIKEKSKATKDRPTAKIHINKTNKIPLRDFGAKKLKSKRKPGVTYRISKTAGRRSVYRDAFMIRAGGHVFRRVGKSRYPLAILHGPSPWGVYVKRNLDVPIKRIATDELKKQIDRQIRQITLGYSKYDKG